MDAVVARELVAQGVAKLEVLSYSDAKALIGREPRTKEVIARDSKRYQFETQMFWDSKQDGDIRIICSVDDGGIRAFAPLTESILIRRKA
jgi:hypothetical protein